MADDIEVTTDPIIVTPTKRSAEEYATKTRELLESFKKGGGTEAEFKKTENYKILKEAYIEASKEEGDLDSPVNKFEFSAAETAKNFLPSLGTELGYLADAVTSPVQTGKALINLFTGVVQKAIPGVQNSEKHADALIKYYSNKYGSKEQFLRYLQEQPAAVLGDAAMILTGGGSTVRLAGVLGKTNNIVSKLGTGIQKTGAAIDPLNLTLNTGGVAATKAIDKFAPDLASDLYQSAMKPTGTLAERKRVVKTALDNDIPLNIEGVGKLELLINDVGSRLDNLILESTNTGKKIPVSKIFEMLQKTREQMKGAKFGVKNKLAELKAFEDKLKADLNLGKFKSLSADELQTLKRSLYEENNWNTKKQKGTSGGEQAISDTGRITKELIEEIIPEAKATNKTFGDLLELKPVLERAVGRIGGRDSISIGGGIKASGGAAVAGPFGAKVAVAQSIFDLPGPKSKAARMIARKSRQGLLQYGDNNPYWSLLRNVPGEAAELKRQNPGITNLEDYFE